MKYNQCYLHNVKVNEAWGQIQWGGAIFNLRLKMFFYYF